MDGRLPVASDGGTSPREVYGAVSGRGDQSAIFDSLPGREALPPPRRLNLKHGFMKFIVDNQLARREYEEEQLQQRVERTAEMRREQQTLVNEFNSKCNLDDRKGTRKPKRREVRVRAGFGAYTPPHTKNRELGLPSPPRKADGATCDKPPTPAEKKSMDRSDERPVPTDSASTCRNRERKERRVRPGFGAYVPPAQRSEKTPT
ncbi:unnamed protein product [Ostreobium quekettii]|uniref:Uncharacterized protein n=1 Tax=Ostreobium quekettii TaxID=121088 RepID=A0A8S1JBK9_9CHLO|nr:unnamed protein product [Ostreobium quekettii]|eukprot:evm.model.scf_1360EXC.1 EVM.evm.TU.scf_1360EXC.1   scf_1360EXC:13646-14965(+)